ncbi:MAG: T9SS type A sorting domain-containing protein [Bacteroidota bacterium]
MKMYLLLTVLWISVVDSIKTQVIAQWNFESLNTAVLSLPYEAEIYSFKVKEAYARLVGGNNNGSPTICSGDESWSTNFWPTQSTRNPNAYLEFSATANDEYRFVVSGFAFRSNVSSLNGPKKMDIYYSTDGFSSDINFLGTSSTSTLGYCYSYSYSMAVETNKGGKISFRIYPYLQNVAAQAASLRIDNITIRGSSLLPIGLSHFDLQLNNQSIIVNWSTSYEKDQQAIVLERAIDSHPFEALKTFDAEGNSFTPKHYEYIDEPVVSGVYYYRLKTIENNGKSSYSEVKSINHISVDVSVYPNPISNYINIKVSKDYHPFDVILFDLRGRKLLEKKALSNHTALFIDNFRQKKFLLVIEGKSYRGSHLLIRKK